MLSGSIGHYRILRPLGQGGMGEVYLAEDTKLARRVALKTLPDALQRDAVARQRLLREARAAAALNQPNICTIHEVGEHDGLAFVVMEFVEGETLRDVLARGRLDLDEALRVMTDVADALELQNDRAGAQAEYATFLTMWKDGDADLPVIVDAKQRLAKLSQK